MYSFDRALRELVIANAASIAPLPAPRSGITSLETCDAARVRGYPDTVYPAALAIMGMLRSVLVEDSRAASGRGSENRTAPPSALASYEALSPLITMAALYRKPAALGHVAQCEGMAPKPPLEVGDRDGKECPHFRHCACLIKSLERLRESGPPSIRRI